MVRLPGPAHCHVSGVDSAPSKLKQSQRGLGFLWKVSRMPSNINFFLFFPGPVLPSLTSFPITRTFTLPLQTLSINCCSLLWQNAWRKELAWAHSSRRGLSWEGGTVTGTWGHWSRMFTVRKQREKSMLSAGYPFFPQSGTPDHGMMSLTFKVSLCHSVKPFWKHP